MLHLTANGGGELAEYGKYPTGMTGNPMLEMHQEYNDAYADQMMANVKYTAHQMAMQKL